jgi:subfamily B ATP-binding cassette protein MsbA
MTEPAIRERRLHNFRRALTYLWPQRRTLLIGLIAAVGVSVFYTFSVSSVVPILKTIFAEHESLVDWVHRAETEHRLGVRIAPDLPDDPAGLLIASVKDDSPNADVLTGGARIVALSDASVSSYEAARRLARHAGTSSQSVTIDAGGERRVVTLHLRDHQWFWPVAERVAGALPLTRDADGRYQTLLVVMSLFVLAALLGSLCRFLNDGMVNTAVQQAMHALRTDLAAHTLRLPVNWHSTQPPGDTLARFANDIAKVQVGMSTLFGKVVREPLKAVGVLCLTVLIDWRMLIIAVIGLPIGAFAIRLFGRLIKRAQRRASESWGRLLDHLGERIAGIRVVKACNMQAAESARFEAEGRELTRAQVHIEMVDAASKPVLEFLASLAVAAFVLYGGYRVFHGDLEPHLFFGAVVLLGGIFDPMRKMGNVNNRLQAAEASAQRLFDLMRLPAEEPALEPAPAAAPDLREGIAFEGVWFAYPSVPDRFVLRDVSLHVPRGQVVAVVGGNGAGKTTLVSLLLRFFDPARGRILIDGRDIAELPLADLRNRFGLVTQEAVIFSDTVRGNIAYGANGAADEDVQRAARLAHVDDFVQTLRVENNGDIATGYDVRINARTLSGGQRQRIALARAILRDPPVLILDEATSQIDSESEQKIQEALDDVTRDRTTFVIAHRFSTIARADRIIVLHDGHVVGVGRHDQLLETCGPYETLVKTQFAQGV